MMEELKYSNNCDNNEENTSELSSIQEFYKDATVFITGATGFLGKILVEKLLRYD